MRTSETVAAAALQEHVVAFIRAFGLHRPDETPCGQPVSVSEAHALLELSRAGPVAQSELRTRLGLEKSTVSRLVADLAARGWLQREPTPGDGRAVQLALTAAGRRAAAELAAARRAKFERLLARIPEEERSSVERALDVLVEALRETR